MLKLFYTATSTKHSCPCTDLLPSLLEPTLAQSALHLLYSSGWWAVPAPSQGAEQLVLRWRGLVLLPGDRAYSQALSGIGHSRRNSMTSGGSSSGQ